MIIPGNDDAIRAIKLFLSVIADAILEGKAEFEAQQEGLAVEEEKEEPTISLIDTEGDEEGVGVEPESARGGITAAEGDPEPASASLEVKREEEVKEEGAGTSADTDERD